MKKIKKAGDRSKDKKIDKGMQASSAFFWFVLWFRPLLRESFASCAPLNLPPVKRQGQGRGTVGKGAEESGPRPREPQWTDPAL